MNDRGDGVSESPRVAVYTRVARAGNPVAQDLQQFECWDWAETRGMEIAHVYRSVGQNDLFLDLLNDIAAGKYDAVVASKHNRYSRHAVKVVTLTEVARKHGVAVHVVEWDDLDLTSPTGQFRLDLMGGFEDLERERAIAEEQVRKSRKGLS
ncbi:recombinase family protein [Streptomyces sp. NPDC006265]|uniref:recombinase family protein n=1 Tax=Streptomyces sp. NPDC006265 TaxID=3156740 RepID=UPI0033A5690A